MKGRHEITVQNRRVQYRFSVERNLTILRGDSATGKTTLIGMIADYQRAGKQSGIELRSDKPCAVLTSQNWEQNLRAIHDSIVFIDEGEIFVRKKEFAEAVEASDNYFVIATRASLPNLPYSTKEIYGIKNNAGNRYQGTKRLYAGFYPLCKTDDSITGNPDLVIVEDSNAGFEFFQHFFSERGIRCISAGGNSRILKSLLDENYRTALVIADGAAFGPYIENIMQLSKAKNIVLYLPESFEWIVLASDVLRNREIREILQAPAEYIDSKTYFSWERFFTMLLTEQSRGTYLEYSKKNLNPNYLQPNVVLQIKTVFSEEER